MREGGVIKLAPVYMFPRRRTNGTFAAPSVGEIYQTEQIVLQSCIHHYNVCQITKNLPSDFSTFSITGGQIWRKIIKICTSSILRENFQIRTLKIVCTVYCSHVNSKSTNRCLFGNFYTYVNFSVQSRYEFREC